MRARAWRLIAWVVGAYEVRAHDPGGRPLEAVTYAWSRTRDRARAVAEALAVTAAGPYDTVEVLRRGRQVVRVSRLGILEDVAAAERVIDAWEAEEGESLRGPHRQTFVRLISAALAQRGHATEDVQ